MTTIQSIRKEIKKIIDRADNRTLKMVFAMLKIDKEYSVWTDEEFVKELQKRDNEMEKGKNNFSWADVKANNRKGLVKKAI